MKNQQVVLTPDGFVVVALTGDSSTVFVPIGPQEGVGWHSFRGTVLRTCRGGKAVHRYLGL